MKPRRPWPYGKWGSICFSLTMAFTAGACAKVNHLPALASIVIALGFGGLTVFILRNLK